MKDTGHRGNKITGHEERERGTPRIFAHLNIEAL